ncbi:MAG: OsmC family protein [Planctomycetota bacterium]|jgi:uncharacterized OsmC-like protein
MSDQKTMNLVNGVNMDALEDLVDTIQERPELGESKFHIHNKWIRGGHNRTNVTDFFSAGQNISHKQSFELDAGEPPVIGGEDKGANPVEYLLHALAACLTTSMVCHAAIQGIRIDELESELEGDIDLRGLLGLSQEARKGYRSIRIKFKIKTDEENLEKLEALTKFSPVFDVVSNGTSVDIQIERE